MCPRANNPLNNSLLALGWSWTDVEISRIHGVECQSSMNPMDSSCEFSQYWRLIIKDFVYPYSLFLKKDLPPFMVMILFFRQFLVYLFFLKNFYYSILLLFSHYIFFATITNVHDNHPCPRRNGHILHLVLMYILSQSFTLQHDALVPFTNFIA